MAICCQTDWGTGTDNVWGCWVNTSTTATTDYVWRAWIDTGTGSATVTASMMTTDRVWIAWMPLVETSITQDQIVTFTPAREETEEEKQARIAREQEQERIRLDRERQYLEEEKKRIAEREAAVIKSERLLLESLNAAQKSQYLNTRGFEVISKGSKRRYRVDYGSHGNVKLLDDKGKVLKSYCGQPIGDLPVHDHMLAQKLFLEHNEEAYLKVANASAAA